METSWNKIFIFNLISVSYNNPGIDLPISIFSIFMLLDVYFFLLVNLFFRYICIYFAKISVKKQQNKKNLVIMWPIHD